MGLEVGDTGYGQRFLQRRRVEMQFGILLVEQRLQVAGSGDKNVGLRQGKRLALTPQTCVLLRSEISAM